MNSKTIFHEMNHAAQLILNTSELKPYSGALMEVETRMILLYQAFKLADPETRKDQIKMVNLLINTYSDADISDLMPLLGDFYVKPYKTYELNSNINDYFKQNKIEYNRQTVYQIIYNWYSNNDKNNSVNVKNFNILMQFYAEWLKRRFDYKYDPNQFKPDYHLFNNLK